MFTRGTTRHDHNMALKKHSKLLLDFLVYNKNKKWDIVWIFVSIFLFSIKKELNAKDKMY